MDSTKLKDVLADIEAQISAYQEAAVAIRKALQLLEDGSAITVTGAGFETKQQVAVKETRTYVDDSVEIFTKIGKTLHIAELAKEMSSFRGATVSRASLESTLVRHISKTNQPKVARFGRGMFGLAIWKESQPTLAQIA